MTSPTLPPDYLTASRSPSPSPSPGPSWRLDRSWSSAPSSRASSLSRSAAPSRSRKTNKGNKGKGKAAGPALQGDELVTVDLQRIPHSGYPPHLIAATQNLDLSKPLLRLVVQEWGNGVVPPRHGDDGRGKRVAGIFVCVSPVARRTRAVRVVLRARLRLRLSVDNAHSDRLWEDADIFRREVVLDGDTDEEDGLELSAGVNVFEFGFDLPADAPTSDRCKTGEVSWTLRGIVEGTGPRFFGKSDLTVERSIWVIPWPAYEDGASLQFSHHSESLTEHFGPLALDASANEFAVASAMYFSIKMPAPPPNLKIYSVRIYVVQMVSHESQRMPGKVIDIAGPKLFIIQEGEKSGWGLSGFPQLARDKGTILYSARDALDKGNPNEWEFTRFGRLPDGSELRPATQPLTKTALRFSSNLVVEIIFSNHDPSDPAEEVVQVATIYEAPMEVASCGCIMRQFHLPTYADGMATPRVTVEDLTHNNLGELWEPCQCEATWESLLAREKEAMARGIAGPNVPMVSLSTEEDWPRGREQRPRKAGETYPVGAGSREWIRS